MWVTGEYFDSARDAAVAARGRLDDRLPWLFSQAAHRPLIVRARASGAEAWLFLIRDGARGLSSAPYDGGPVLLGDPDPRTRDALLRAVGRRLRLLGAARLTLDALAVEDARALADAFRAAGWRAVEAPASPTLAIDIQGRGFDDYWDGRSERLHERVAAGSRRLTVEIADRLTPALWEEAALVGPLDTCLTAISDRLSREGALRLGFARIGDAPVAAQLWLLRAGTAVAIWRAADPEARVIFPAAHLTAAMLRYVVNVDGVARVELGRDDADWAEEHRPRRRLRLFNPRRPGVWPALAAARAAALVRRPTLD